VAATSSVSTARKRAVRADMLGMTEAQNLDVTGGPFRHHRRTETQKKTLHERKRYDTPEIRCACAPLRLLGRRFFLKPGKPPCCTRSIAEVGEA